MKLLPVINCPSCQIAIPAGTTVCPDCGEELAPFLRLQLDPYVTYNEGLRLAKNGDLDLAIIKLGEVVTALPDEPSAYVVLGKLYAQKEDWVNARYWWGKIADRWPDEVSSQAGLTMLAAQEAASRTQMEAAATAARRRQRRDAIKYAGLGGLVIGLLAILGVFIWDRPVSEPTAVAVSLPTQTATFVSPTATVTPIPSPLPSPTFTPIMPTAEPTNAPEQRPTATAVSPTASPIPSPPLSFPNLVLLAQDVILAQPKLASLAIIVHQDRDNIWLEGVVPNVATKYQLEALMKELPGMGLVDVSGLQVVYTIQTGDSLWDISENMYGDGRYWTLIASSNQISQPGIILPNHTLQIPPP